MVDRIKRAGADHGSNHELWQHRRIGKGPVCIMQFTIQGDLLFNPRIGKCSLNFIFANQLEGELPGLIERGLTVGSKHPIIELAKGLRYTAKKSQALVEHNLVYPEDPKGFPEWRKKLAAEIAETIGRFKPIEVAK